MVAVDMTNLVNTSVQMGNDGMPYVAVYRDIPIWLNTWFVIGVIVLILTIIALIIMWILWYRRRLVFTNFLTATGQWERKSWHRSKISENFEYDGSPYKYNIMKCTRDRINRPIAHYYKGNPEQQEFDFKLANPRIWIGTTNIDTKDFVQLMKTKVLKDIFSDDEVMNWLMLIFVVMIILNLAILAVAIFVHPSAPLKADNQTLNVIAQGCKMALGIKNGGGVV